MTSEPERTLADAHRLAAQPLGQMALALARRAYGRAALMHWASSLRASAALLEALAGAS